MKTYVGTPEEKELQCKLKSLINQGKVKKIKDKRYNLDKLNQKEKKEIYSLMREVNIQFCKANGIKYPFYSINQSQDSGS